MSLAFGLGHGEYLVHILAVGQWLLVSVGQHLADTSLWIAITSFLTAFSVHNALDEHGEDIQSFRSSPPAP